MHPGSMTEQPRRQHSRIVENQEFIAAQKIGKVRETAVHALTAAAIHKQQSGCVALRQRALRDQ